MASDIFSDDSLDVFDMKHLSLNEIVPQNNDYRVLQEIFKSNLALLLVF